MLLADFCALLLVCGFCFALFGAAVSVVFACVCVFVFFHLLFCCCVSLCLVAYGLWVLGSLGLFLILFGCFLGWSFESLGLFSFDLVFFWVLAFGFAAAAFLSLLRLSLAGVFGVCTIPFGSFIACLYLLGVQQ